MLISEELGILCKDEYKNFNIDIFMGQLKSYRFYIITFLFTATELFAQSSFERAAISHISPKRMQTAVRDLVSFGNRVGGSPSGDQSAFYVAKQFKGYGYRPQIIKGPELLAYINISWILAVDTPRSLSGLIQHEWIAGFSPKTPLRKSQLVFQSANEIPEKQRIDGKVVLIDSHISYSSYIELAKSGAVCVLSYEPNAAIKQGATITSLPRRDDNPIPLFNISSANGFRLRRELEKGRKITIKYSVDTKIKKGLPKTVTATLRGEKDEYYIVCAHGDSDSGGPGADDNASGVAGVLELSRIMQKLVHSSSAKKPKYSIKFIVWGAERYSTEHYIEMNKKNLAKIKGVINFDEIGIGKSRNCLYFEGNDVPHNSELLHQLCAVGEEFADKKGFWNEATSTPSLGGTDSNNFLPDGLKRLGIPIIEIPAITVFTAAWNMPEVLAQTPNWKSKAWKGHPDSVVIDYSPYYHSSIDIPALTTDKEPANMVWAVKAVAITLIRILWN